MATNPTVRQKTKPMRPAAPKSKAFNSKENLQASTTNGTDQLSSQINFMDSYGKTSEIIQHPNPELIANLSDEENVSNVISLKIGRRGRVNLFEFKNSCKIVPSELKTMEMVRDHVDLYGNRVKQPKQSTPSTVAPSYELSNKKTNHKRRLRIRERVTINTEDKETGTKSSFQSQPKNLADVHSEYYIFIQGQDAIYMYPVREWLNFSEKLKYTTLNDEEAEKEFTRRENVFNRFALMAEKRRRDEDVEDELPSSSSQDTLPNNSEIGWELKNPSNEVEYNSDKSCVGDVDDIDWRDSDSDAPQLSDEECPLFITTPLYIPPLILKKRKLSDIGRE